MSRRQSEKNCCLSTKLTSSCWKCTFKKCISMWNQSKVVQVLDDSSQGLATNDDMMANIVKIKINYCAHFSSFTFLFLPNLLKIVHCAAVKLNKVITAKKFKEGVSLFWALVTVKPVEIVCLSAFSYRLRCVCSITLIISCCVDCA